jgi:hypothetical protein
VMQVEPALCMSHPDRHPCLQDHADLRVQGHDIDVTAREPPRTARPTRMGGPDPGPERRTFQPCAALHPTRRYRHTGC